MKYIIKLLTVVAAFVSAFVAAAPVNAIDKAIEAAPGNNAFDKTVNAFIDMLTYDDVQPRAEMLANEPQALKIYHETGTDAGTRLTRRGVSC